MKLNGWLTGKIFPLLAGIACMAGTAQATQFTVDAGLPGGGDCAVFGSWNAQSRTCRVQDASLASGDSLVILSGRFQIDGTFTNEGLFNNNDGTLIVNGFLNNTESLVNFWPSTMIVRGRYFSHFMYNFGAFFNEEGASVDFDFFLENNATLRNYGSIDIGGNVINIPSRLFDNRGSVTVKSTADWNNEGTIVNVGSIEIIGLLENLERLVNHCEGSLSGGPVIGNLPTEALTLRLDAGSLHWCDLNGASTADVLTGSLEALRSSGGDFSLSTIGCLADDQGGGSLAESGSLQPGAGAWFLVRPNFPSGGSYDSDFGSQVAGRDAGLSASGVDCP